MANDWDALGVGHAYAPGREPDPWLGRFQALIERLDGPGIIGLFIVATVVAIIIVGFGPTPRLRVRMDPPGSGADLREIETRGPDIHRAEIHRAEIRKTLSERARPMDRRP